jgi:hypothetical protein
MAGPRRWKFRWWPTVVFLSISIVIGLVLHWWTGIPFWIGFVLTAAALFLNGLLAGYEDNRPGGFNNP